MTCFLEILYLKLNSKPIEVTGNSPTVLGRIWIRTMN